MATMVLFLLMLQIIFTQQGESVGPDVNSLDICSSEAMFACDKESCVDQSKRCNGVNECWNGRDEQVQDCGCQTDEFQCNSSHCIELHRRCDLNTDCHMAEDELNCETYICPATHVKCANHACLPRDLQCDHKNDCGDNSDETNCEYRECYSTEFRCENEECIPETFLCDGNADCYDRTDEQQCDEHILCANGLYVAQKKACDGWIDCAHSMDDELYCTCKAHQHRCNNSRCINTANLCDGVCDCGEECDDERNCYDVPCHAPFFPCQRTHRCLRPEYVCDGHNDCWDTSEGGDEENCNVDPIFQRCNGVWCDNHCVTSSLLCDQIVHCINGEDEYNCDFEPCKDDEFTCKFGQCVPASGRCDLKFDCNDLSDEMHCEQHKCPSKSLACYNGQCVPESQWCDHHMDCLDGSDELQCANEPSCAENEFRCNNGQCIPQELECVSITKDDATSLGCRDNSHLLNCISKECGLDMFKCRNSYCVNASAVCNNNVDCKATHTDELHCSYLCPFHDPYCTCQDEEMNCEHKNLSLLPDTKGEKGLTKFNLAWNNLNNTLNHATFLELSALKYLDLQHNDITHLEKGLFSSQLRLSTLNLAYNRITHIYNGTFSGLINLDSLYIQGNQIEYLDQFAFQGLSSLKVLDLSGQKLQHLQAFTFMGLRQLYKLNLSDNGLTHLVDGTFNGLSHLLSLDISHNKLQVIEDNVFHGLLNLNMLTTDEFRFCCLAPFVDACLPEPNEFSSCEDLMSNNVLRMSIWILGVVSLAGNVLVVVWRMKDSRDSKVHSFLITNLAIGDMLMGIYLLIIAGVDIRYRGVYIIYDLFWRESSLCKFAGFLSTFSSELSVLTLTVITIDRLISIIFPFRLKRLGKQEAHIVMLVLWLVVLLLSAIPLMGNTYFDNFYGRSGVCLALHITPDPYNGWEYSVFIFLVLNGVSISAISVAYIWMFLVARRTRSAARSPEMKKDHAMARRMTLIVLTDFLCWMPIIVLGFASLGGVTIPPQVYAWIAVFILPLNAAVNPLLYTLSTAPFLGHARRRATRFRQSFLSSLTVTQDTKISNDERSGSSERTRYFPISFGKKSYSSSIPLRGVHKDKPIRTKWQSKHHRDSETTITSDNYSKVDYSSMYD